MFQMYGTSVTAPTDRIAQLEAKNKRLEAQNEKLSKELQRLRNEKKAFRAALRPYIGVLAYDE